MLICCRYLKTPAGNICYCAFACGAKRVTVAEVKLRRSLTWLSHLLDFGKKENYNQTSVELRILKSDCNVN